MGQRAEAFAEQFEQANNALIAAVEGYSDAQWRAKCPDEEWPVAVTAHHVAGGHAMIAGLAEKIASGQPLPPITMDDIHQGNAAHAEQFTNCTKQETLDLLRSNGQAAANTVRSLSDEQLDRSGEILGGSMTTGQVIERILIGHVQGHSASIRAAATAG